MKLNERFLFAIIELIKSYDYLRDNYFNEFQDLQEIIQRIQEFLKLDFSDYEEEYKQSHSMDTLKKGGWSRIINSIDIEKNLFEFVPSPKIKSEENFENGTEKENKFKLNEGSVESEKIQDRRLFERITTFLSKNEKEIIDEYFYNFEFIQMIISLSLNFKTLETNWENVDFENTGELSLIDMYLSLRGFYPGNSIGNSF